MTKSVRLAASCLFAAALLAASRAADSAPPAAPVIERAPETDPAAELATLREQNKRLAAELVAAVSARAQDSGSLQDSTRELATLRAKLARLEAAPAATDSLQQQLESAKAALATRTHELNIAQAALATAETHARELAARLTAAEAKLADAQRQTAAVTAENQLLKTAAAEQTQLTAEVQQLRQDKAALEQKLAAVPAPAPAAAPENPAAAARLTEAESKLATTLRSYSLLQAENDQLKTALADHEKLTAELASLRQDKSALEARLAAAEKPAAPAEPSLDLSGRLADVENKLATALRSYSLLQTENDQLKADDARAAESAQTAAAKSSSESAAQISALYDSLRQTQAQAVALAAENSQLKTRLALVGPPPGTTLASPTRPGAASTTLTPTPLPDSAPPAAPAAPEARIHRVMPGDTLGKISRQYYGTASRWEEILRANPDVIKNENVVPVGATLRIP